jgi:hypothetical protein
VEKDWYPEPEGKKIFHIDLEKSCNNCKLSGILSQIINILLHLLYSFLSLNLHVFV